MSHRDGRGSGAHHLLGERVATPVSLVDLLPSLLALAGLDGAQARFDGASFIAIQQGRDTRIRPSRQPKLAELVIRERCILRAVLDGDWKYIATYKDCSLGERRELAQRAC